MIVDKNEYDKFIEILPEVEKDEVYFVSLSARNKYLNAEERIQYSLGRTEMFSREIAYDKEHLSYVLKKLKASLLYRRTNNGSEIPEKALVTYININPSSTMKAFTAFTNKMDKHFMEIFMCERSNKETNYFPFTHISRSLLNHVQKCRGTKHFIDIDMDVKHLENGLYFLNIMREKLSKYNVINYVIETQGGYHLLIKKDTLVKEVKLYKVIELLHDSVKDQGGEVKFNKNEMCPLPGTLQAGKVVKIIK